jgi:alkanesulfonate monooxygenase SsuD/methylene tetrahydromethanopterin reductase-like flavin-dependent oxidoreductase (luciferase family)
VFTLRFDMRAPASGAPTVELYAAALEMSGWADEHGATAIVLSEHYGADDGHVPTPLLLAAAIAARTTRVGIVLAAVVLPFYDPVRLAEDICVLDILSRGRAMHVLGIGHRSDEYEHFGLDVGDRGRLADEKLDFLLRLLRDRKVIDGDRAVRVSPRPLHAEGPPLLIGGGSVAAARRAGRHGLGLMAQANPPGLRQAYEEACRLHGHEPGHVRLPDPAAPTVVFVADDPEQAWDELGPHILHDAVAAASYRPGDDNDNVASITRATTIGELRRPGSPYRVLCLEDAADVVRDGGLLPLLPLCGGLDVEFAWRYLGYTAEALERGRCTP